MTLAEQLQEYLDGKISAISMIRMLSGMFNPQHAITILAIICSITRVEEGDMDREFFKSYFIDGKREEKNESESTNN